MADKSSEFKDLVYWLTWNIPKGQWLSYGSLAAYSGSPRAARQVGGMAHYGPSYLPWHRVVKRGGYLATGFPGGLEVQKHLLLEIENIEFDSDKIVAPVTEWAPPLNLRCPLIVIVGETASGKSSLAMRISELYHGSIICADSWTVRKGLDIGTAKPTYADQSLVPHYMLDVVEPDEYYSAGLFQAQALQAIQDIVSKQRLPIITSGNGLYTDSILYAYSFLEEHNETLRKKLQSMTLQQIKEQVDKLKLDTTGIDIRNKRRLMRLIETNGAVPLKSPVMRPNTLVIGLRHTRASLRRRIEDRVETMFELGLEQEAGNILSQFGAGCEAMKGIGYAEFIGYFEGDKSIDKVKSDIVSSTIGLAKRQRTWFKRNHRIIWHDTSDDVITTVQKFLERGAEAV